MSWPVPENLRHALLHMPAATAPAHGMHVSHIHAMSYSCLEAALTNTNTNNIVAWLSKPHTRGFAIILLTHHTTCRLSSLCVAAMELR